MRVSGQTAAARFPFPIGMPMLNVPCEFEHENHTPTWRIYSKWLGHTSFLGVVTAQAEHLAIQQAIEQFQITSLEHQKRLVAERREHQ